MAGQRFVVVNQSRGTCLASRAEKADSLLRRMKGLIGREQQDFTDGCGLWIVPCDGVHTFGMRFPIDVAYLDSKYRVMKVYHHMRRFRLGAIKLTAHSVLELPAGTLARTATEVGDTLNIKSNGDEPD